MHIIINLFAFMHIPKYTDLYQYTKYSEQIIDIKKDACICNLYVKPIYLTPPYLFREISTGIACLTSNNNKKINLPSVFYKVS